MTTLEKVPHQDISMLTGSCARVPNSVLFRQKVGPNSLHVLVRDRVLLERLHRLKDGIET